MLMNLCNHNQGRKCLHTHSLLQLRCVSGPLTTPAAAAAASTPLVIEDEKLSGGGGGRQGTVEKSLGWIDKRSRG